MEKDENKAHPFGIEYSDDLHNDDESAGGEEDNDNIDNESNDGDNDDEDENDEDDKDDEDENDEDDEDENDDANNTIIFQDLKTQIKNDREKYMSNKAFTFKKGHIHFMRDRKKIKRAKVSNYISSGNTNKTLNLS